MGKASRRKRSQGGGRVRVEVERWLANQGIRTVTDRAFWDRADQLDGDWADRWAAASSNAEGVRLLFESLETMRLVEGYLRADQHAGWLTWIGLHVRDQSPSVIVDLGCGHGLHTRWVAERWPDAQVVGVEPNPAARAIAGLVNDGVPNVTLVADVAEVTAGTVDLLLGSLVVHEIDPQLMEPGVDPFATLRSVETVLSDPYRSPAADMVRRVLHDDGMAIMLLRSPDLVVHSRWTVAAHSAGMSVVSEDTLEVRVLGEVELLRVQILRPDPQPGELTVDELGAGWADRAPIAAEFELREIGATDVLWAVQIDYPGGGTERVELRATPGRDQFVAWRTTDLNYRDIVHRANDPGAVERWRVEFGEYADQQAAFGNQVTVTGL